MILQLPSLLCKQFISGFYFSPTVKIMAADGKSTKVTELMVAIDCNGCAKKFTRILHAIEGVNDVKIDKSQQKITVFGDADPGIILKALRKTRKTVKICSPVKKKPSNGDLQSTEEEEEHKYFHGWNINQYYHNYNSHESENSWPLQENQNCRVEDCRVVYETEYNYEEVDEDQITNLFSDENPNACTIF